MNKFSIITVCLNAEQEIGNTIQSVLDQTYPDFEYLIKDGGSTDQTIRIAESFGPKFAERGIPFRVLSQPDTGIYDAMNQAVSETHGQWINFMNAGDWFADNNILELVQKSGCLEDSDVVYGDRILRKQNRFCFDKAYPLEEMRIGLPFGHQSSFVRRDFLVEKTFSLRYPICSDFHFFLQLYRENKKFTYFPEAISIYDVNGVSSDWKRNYRDKIQILEEMPVRDEEAIQRLKKRMDEKYRAEFLHQHLWRFLPKPLREKRRERMRRKAGWKTEEEFFGTKKDNP